MTDHTDTAQAASARTDAQSPPPGGFGISLKTKIIGAAILLSVILVAMGLISYERFGEIRQNTRAIVQHLTRLQTLLKDVLDALEGGFLKKSAVKVWEAVDGEVHQLEHLLQQACPLLLTTLDDMHRIAAKASDAGEALHANSLAAEYLFDKVDASVGNLLTSRLTALSTSQALVLEQLQSLSLDQQRVQELMTLVQDGVLIQLPSVYSQLAGLSAKPSDTQRFLAAEKLTDIVQFIQRKL